MNLFGGFGNMFGGQNDNCCCQIIWLLFLLQICGCGGGFNTGCGNECGGGHGCMDIIFLLILLSCCGCKPGCN